MHTITILAEALAQASRLEILRLDISYNHYKETYSGRLVLGYGKEFDSWIVYDINDNGTISLVKMNEGEEVSS